MLENSLWHKYSPNKSITEALTEFYKIDAEQIGGNDNELYAILKRHLTKKEFRLFIMNEAGFNENEIMTAMLFDTEGYESTKRKAYRKLKQDKLRNLILNSGVSNIDTEAKADTES